MAKKKKKLPDIVELTFRVDHSLMVGHKPENVGLQCIGNACAENLTAKKVAKFGLFDSSAPNYTTYYPQATAEDWTPKDSDFIEPVFRLLSETTLINMGIPIDFSRKGVLKASMDKLVGATINPDHEPALGNALGAIKEVAWQSSTTQNGVKVPAGINGVLKIDAKSNTRIARAINMDPPAIHSSSVTVKFKHEPSHPKMENFWDMIGTYDDKGELIRVVATEIDSYKELSLVSHGADPYAQKIENGKLNNPEYADSVYKFSADYNGTVDFKDLDENGTLIGSFEFDNSHNSNLNNNDMKFTEFLVALGLAEDAYTDMAAFLTHYQEVTGSLATLTGLLAIQEDLTPDSLQALSDNQKVEGEVVLQEGEEIITEAQTATLNKVTELGGLDNLDENAALGVTYLNTIRNKAIADYKVIHGDGADENIIKTIENADLEAAKSFEASYQADLDKKAPLACQDCGSLEISRKSVAPKSEKKETSFKETRDKFANLTRKKASNIHGDIIKQD